MAKVTLATPATDALFSAAEISSFIENAFTASVNPAFGDSPLSEDRLAYCRAFALALMTRLEAGDIVPGHMNYTEAVAMLLGTALALQKLHGK